MGDENVLELGGGDGCIIIMYGAFSMVSFRGRELYFIRVVRVSFK